MRFLGALIKEARPHLGRHDQVASRQEEKSKLKPFDQLHFFNVFDNLLRLQIGNYFNLLKIIDLK